MGHLEDFHDPLCMEECLCEAKTYGDGGVWTTKDYQEIPICQMATSHLRNAIRYLLKRVTKYRDDLLECCEEYIWERIRALETEAKKRGTKC